jgi:hypothetical protein
MRQPCHPPPPDAPHSTCDVCAHGCDCPPDGPGCGHYGCFGRAPRTCPGVEAEEARYRAALAAKRAADARTLTRRARLGASYRGVVLSTLAAARLAQ